MKLITLITLLSFGFIGCKEEKTFDAFDFSFGNTFETDFSIKFTHSDTVFIRENWSYYDIDENVTSPKSKTNYFSLLTKSQKTDLNKLLEGIEFSKFDTLYYDDYSDGSEYKFHIKRNNLEKTILFT